MLQGVIPDRCEECGTPAITLFGQDEKYLCIYCKLQAMDRKIELLEERLTNLYTDEY